MPRCGCLVVCVGVIAAAIAVCQLNTVSCGPVCSQDKLADADYNGTTRHIESIFLGRCYTFFSLPAYSSAAAELCLVNASTAYDCQELWREFSSAVIGKPPCAIQVEDFAEFLRKTYHPVPQNTSLFWSGTYRPAHDLARFRRYWSLEDTLSGYLLNQLDFCSSLDSEHFSFDACPIDCVYRNNPFWQAASVDFARRAVGEVLVVLNGTRNYGAIANYSFFVKYELPQFSAERIHKVKVLLLHTPGSPKYETCQSPSTLLYLQSALAEKAIEYECEDNFQDTLLLMCIYDPSSVECESIKSMIVSVASAFFSRPLLLVLAILVNSAWIAYVC